MANNDVVDNARISLFSSVHKPDGDSANPFLVEDAPYQRDGKTASPSPQHTTGVEVEFLEQRPGASQKVPKSVQQMTSSTIRDSMAVALLEALNKANSLILKQGERIEALESNQRSKSPPRKDRNRKVNHNPSPKKSKRHGSRSPPPRQRRHRRDQEDPDDLADKKCGRSPTRSHRSSPEAKRSKDDRRSPAKRSPTTKSRNRSKSRSPRKNRNPRQDRSPRDSSPSSDDDDPRGPLSREILNTKLPRGLEKPPPLGQYDGTTDPDEHIENIDALLDYRGVRGAIKCRLFPTTLRKGAMTWYKSLPRESITSWK